MARWANYWRKMKVEDANARITAREARHHGIEVVEVPIPKSNATRPLAVCRCGRRCWYLYQKLVGDPFLCMDCNEMTYRSNQQRATNAAFNAEIGAEKSHWRARWEELFNPLYAGAMEEARAAIEETWPLARHAEIRRALLIEASTDAETRIGQQVAAQVKAEWRVAIRTPKKPRRKNRTGQFEKMVSA